jgi:hypothetical protein
LVKYGLLPFYTIGDLVAFGAVEVALFLLAFLGYFLITCIAFHKPIVCIVKRDKLSSFGKISKLWQGIGTTEKFNEGKVDEEHLYPYFAVIFISSVLPEY